MTHIKANGDSCEHDTEPSGSIKLAAMGRGGGLLAATVS
jgi:hypothetical protein